MSRVVRHTPTNPEVVANRAAVPEDPDKYLDKLVKYVPAEVTAIAAGLFAAWTLEDWKLWLALAVLAVLNVLYLWVCERQDKTAPDTQWYFYVLATVAFGAWAISVVEPVADAFGVDSEGQRAFVLAAAAFLIPLLDIAAGFVFRNDKT
jgi:peptidoglycan biosynthesis protein MviN/MurJ (putative lipid II flippase)